MDVKRIREILASGEFNQFIDEIEDHYFECKGDLYQLDKKNKNNKNEKQELAKDVSGFANADGGIIVIGLGCIKPSEKFIDKVDRIRPFSENKFNITQYIDCINEWIYPSIVGLDIKWYPSKENRSKGLGAIEIPKQDQSLFPFLITRYVDLEGKATNIVFGYSKRVKDKIPPPSVQWIHELIQRGIDKKAINQGYETVLLQSELDISPRSVSI